MIAINPVRLSDAYKEMTDIHTLLLSYAADVNDLKRKLSATFFCGGMDDAVLLLANAAEKIVFLALQHKHLCQGLDTVCHLCTDCENRIFDAGEDAIIDYEQPPAVCVDLHETSELLHELQFEIEGSDGSWLLGSLR